MSKKVIAAREQRYIRLTGSANGAELRTAEFDGAQHLVVPVIALVGNSIIRPLNSEGPEFVPAEELSAAPKGWDGRPVLPDHPNNGATSANEPRTLEQYRFGTVFNTRFDETDGKLKMEAWLDPARAEKVGPDAVRVIERCQAGEMVEVSVGVWISSQKVSGIYAGKKYDSVWRDPVPDHLAMLPEGAVGACSVEAGCGAPRAMRAAKNGGNLPMTLPRRMIDALSRAFSTRHAEDNGVGDVDLRNALDDALRATEPGYEWIEIIYPDTSTVVYSVFPGNEIMLMQRTFSIDDDKKVTLNDDRQKVEASVEYKPVAAEGEETGQRSAEAENESVEGESKVESQIQVQSESGCTCHKGENMDKKELIGKVIASKRGLFKEEDRKVLEGMSEERLKALAEVMEEKEEEKKVEVDGEEEKVVVAPVTPPVTPPATPDPNTVQVSAEELASLRSLAADVKRREQEYRGGLIQKLKGAKTTFTDDELKVLSTPVLEKTVTALGLVEKTERSASFDYSMRPLPVDTSADNVVPPPPDMAAAIRASRNRAAN